MKARRWTQVCLSTSELQMIHLGPAPEHCARCGGGIGGCIGSAAARGMGFGDGGLVLHTSGDGGHHSPTSGDGGLVSHTSGAVDRDGFQGSAFVGVLGAGAGDGCLLFGGVLGAGNGSQTSLISRPLWTL